MAEFVSRMRCSASAVHRWSGTFTISELPTIPGLRRTIALRYVLRRARETEK
jgi:hypothetical protein